LGSSCRVLYEPFVCSFLTSRDLRAPAVGSCLFFYLFFSGLAGYLGSSAVGCCLFVLSLLFGPRGILGLQLSSIVCPFHLFFSGLQGSWSSSCRVLSILFICSFRASRDPASPSVGYILFLLSVLVGPRAILGLQLLGVICSFCMSFSGLRGSWCINYQILSVSFGPQGILGLQLSGSVMFFVFEEPGNPAVGYCLFYLSVLFWHYGILGL